MLPVSPTLLSNPYEDAGLVLPNLLQGDFGAAGRALLSPESLSPAQRQDIADRYLGGKPGMMKQALDLATNPLVVAGLVLSMAYPIAKADRLLKFGDQIAHYAKVNFPGMRHLYDFRQLFPGKLSAWFEEVTTQNHLFNEKHLGIFNDALDKWYKAGGKWDEKIGYRIAAAMDGLDDPNHQSWKILRSVLPNGSQLIPKGVSPVTNVGLSAADQELIKNIQSNLKFQYVRVIGPKGENLKKLAPQLRKMGFNPTDLEGVTENYFPHIESLSRERLKELYEGWLRSTGASSQVAREMSKTLPTRQLTKRLVQRAGYMFPDPEHLKKMGWWNDGLERAYRLLDYQAAEKGAPAIRHYSLDLPKVLENYTRGMARTNAWSVPQRATGKSFGEMILAETEKVAQQNIVKANMLKDTYIPLATGQLAWEQAVPSMRFTQLKFAAADALESIPGVPSNIKNFLAKPLRESHSITFQRLGSKIQSYFYDTTLVANVTSPLKNLLQHFVTTIPAIGPKYTFRGMEEVRKRAAKYFKLKQSGLDHESAMSKAFSEFYGSGLEIGGVTAQERMRSLVEWEEPGIHLPNKLREGYLKARDRGLALFTGSERFNRLTAFYGSYAKALDELPGTEWIDDITNQAYTITKGSPVLQTAANAFARQMTYLTQFGSGPLAKPYFATQLWGPLSQYTQFPSRVLGFALGPAMRLGGEGKFNPGTLGRMLASSGIAYEGGKALFDADLSSSLLFGALPSLGNENAPWGRLPLVSPFLQVVGSGLSAAAKGDLEDIQRVAPLLVPGGVPAARLATAAAPGVARAINRPWADYESPTPDGRYGVYTGTGSLIGYYTPTQLWAKSIGLGDVQGTNEYALMKYMLSQRDRIREVRRNYLEAIARSDYKGAKAVQAEWSKMFPNMGPLPVKKADITAIHMRREVPRIERLLETLPAELRPQFAQVVSASLGIYGAGLIGIDPALLGTGTIHSRQSLRPQRTPLSGLPDSATQPPSQRSDSILQAGQVNRDAFADQAFGDLQGF